MTEPPTPQKPSAKLTTAWLVAGILGIALLLAMSLFIAGLGSY